MGKKNTCINLWMCTVVEMSWNGSIQRYGCLVEYNPGGVKQLGHGLSCRKGIDGRQPVFAEDFSNPKFQLCPKH